MDVIDGNLEAVYASLFSDVLSRAAPFERAPLMPTDMFAFVAHLLGRSDAYHHIAPDVSGETGRPWRRIVVDDAMRAEATKLGKHWRTAPPKANRRLPSVPRGVEARWRSLVRFADADVVIQLDDAAAAPE